MSHVAYATTKHRPVQPGRTEPDQPKTDPKSKQGEIVDWRPDRLDPGKFGFESGRVRSKPGQNSGLDRPETENTQNTGPRTGPFKIMRTKPGPGRAKPFMHRPNETNDYEHEPFNSQTFNTPIELYEHIPRPTNHTVSSH